MKIIQGFRYLKQNIFFSVIAAAILLSSFEIFWRTFLDEAIYVFIAIYLIFKITFKVDYTSLRNSKIELLGLSYLCLNSLVSFIIDPSFSSLRFVLIYTSFVIILTYLVVYQDGRLKQELVLKLTSSALYIWVGFWFLLYVCKIDWQLFQSKFFAGSTYAAIVPVLGLFLQAYSFIYQPTRQNSRRYWLNCGLTLLASYLYDSRALFLAVILQAILVIILKFSLKNVFVYLCIFITVVLSGNLLSVIGLEKDPNALAWFFSQSKNIDENLQLINSPRLSDQDRSWQILCASKLILMTNDSRIYKSEDPHVLNSIFGFGQNHHKKELLRCYGVDRETPGSGVRSVAFSAFATDFGLVGLFFLFGLIIKRSVQIIRLNARRSVVPLSLLFTLSSWWLITNLLDHSIIFIVFFTSFLVSFINDSKVASTK